MVMVIKRRSVGRPKVDLTGRAYRVTVSLDLDARDYLQKLGEEDGKANFSLGVRRATIKARDYDRMSISFQAAIGYSLTADGGEDFLRLWNEGGFDEIRTEWPDAPPEVYWADGRATWP